MKTFHKKLKFRFSIVTFLFLVLAAGFLFSCVDEGASTNDDNSYGSVAVRIRISSDSDSRTGESVNRHDMAVDPSCQVRIDILNSSSNIIASGGPWNWSDGEGTVTGVPVGSDRTISVKINDPSDSALLYEGEMSGITVSSGANDLTGSPVYVCADFSGKWSWTETAYSDCSGYGTVYSGATIEQDGCDDVSFNVDGFTGYTDGSVEGDTLTLQPVTFTVGSVVTTYSNWSFISNGDSMTGSATWDSSDGVNYCTGTSNFTCTRQ